ncbi:hypothetical protein EDD18DRAFT_1416845 [Armillaria luteobubalina]|uniref:F-box domain-containing protein n=1 Tax=Armillaria luteobubalina TaxID=153913 RepID=A0AA39UJE7_9AGAR|nr:hypothetical protein EDD18DRAFT_1416845 [Armillaria luteobubalina]
MYSQPNLAAFEHDLHSEVEKLPLELFEEIVSYLDIPTIEKLSRVSSVFRKACIPLFFRNLVLSGDSNVRSTEILATFKEKTLVPSLRKVELRGLKEDLSQALIAWCTRVRTIKIEECLVGNTSILPSLIVLYDLELSNLTFAYSRLPPTLKKLAVFGNTFLESQLISYAVGRGIEVEHLQTESAEDLSLLLRDDCPISIKSLRVTHVSQASPHDLERLVQSTPHLIDLKIDIQKPEDRPGITRPPNTVIQLFSTPDIASPLEVVNFSMPVSDWLSGLRRLVVAFSHPRFCKLKQVNITLLQSYSNIRISRAVLNDHARLAERGLEAAGGSPEIQVTFKMERRLARSDGPAHIVFGWHRG